MRKMKKTLALLAIVAMVVTMIPLQVFAADSARLAGADRIATAIAIADAFGPADTVILAAADDANLVDSLAVAPLAGKVSPIYLTYKNGLDPAVKAKLSGKNVIAIGAVSDAVVNEVKTVAASAEKVSGIDRLATNDLINARLTDPVGTFVVGYNAIPDALSVASYAAANNYAIVLANPDGTVNSSKIKGSSLYIIGGPTLVRDITGATRLYGADRFDTNVEVIKALIYSYNKVYVANGLTLVDALSASSLAAKDNAPILLTDNITVKAASTVNPQISDATVVTALGGTGVVSDAVRDQVGFALGEVTTAAVTAKSYDDDTTDQYVAFTVNGQTTTVDALQADGWDVQFAAYDNRFNGNDISADYFADETYGLLNAPITAADIYIQITLTKGADLVVSDLQKITIKNLNLTATSISDYTLYNNTIGDDQDSTTLVVGETATFRKITVNNGDSKEDVTTGYTIKSSKAGVISVTADTVDITAETPGTATITITYGDITKAVSLTVSSDAREVDKARVKNSDDKIITSVKTLKNIPTDVTVEAIDQFGDPMPSEPITVESSNVAVATVALAGDIMTIDSLAAGKATIIIYDGAGNKIGTLALTVSDNTDVAKKTFELFVPATDAAADLIVGGATKADFTTDSTIDIADDLYAALQLNQFNSDGVSVGASQTVSVDWVESKVGVITVNSVDANGKILVEGLKEGTATVKVTDDETGKIYTKKFTVVNQGYTIKSVAFKSMSSPTFAKTFNYKSALTVTETGNDPIIKGITLNKAASQAIRMDLASGQLYIDKDADGLFSADDTDLGMFEIVTVGTFTNSVVSLTDGIKTEFGDDGTIIFKVWNADATPKVVASTSVDVSL
ncbi:MAG TPA: cell wall-binding repeat-containing protein [Desulfitobacteriaceae bacterium]|nr:cell wall-binding repeat-containing protein [Desulfitobacteriaceae bacterium]